MVPYGQFSSNKCFKSKVISFEEEEEKSSHYGLYMLGFTCATRVKTEKSDSVS